MAALMMVLAGCAAPPLLQESDPGFPRGSLLYLNVPVTVPANAVGAPLRGGNIGNRYRYQASCRLEVRTLRREPRVIEPDSFEVLGVSRDRDPLTGPAFPTMGSGFDLFGEGPGLIYFNTYIYLRSELQPDVFRVKCSQLKESDVDPWYLSPEEIRTVLGDIMTVE
jgi:hypothetical protein